MTNVLITGAGADKTAGIDFPLAAQLLPQVSQFLDGEGKAIEETIRAALPGLRFSFTRFINDAISSIATKATENLRDTVQSIQRATAQVDEEEHPKAKKQGDIIIRLFNKLVQLQDDSYIDDDTQALIAEVYGDEFNDSDHIVDIGKMSLSDTFKNILKVTLKQGLADSDNPIASAMVADMLDIEQLLIQKFLGFYNDNTSDVKSYVYISWCFWAFLVQRQRHVTSAHAGQDLPFYAGIPNNIAAITLNYTTFLLDNTGLPANRVIHFHGGLNEYVRMDIRQLVTIDNFNGRDIESIIREDIVPNIKFDAPRTRDQQHVIPSLVPPLRLKPVLSQKYIDLWHQAAELIHQAEKVVVVGYSFNSADEHFNDIIRNDRGHTYDIVAPDANSDAFVARISKVFSKPRDQFTRATVQGKPTMQCRDVRLIAARADEVDLAALFESGS